MLKLRCAVNDQLESSQRPWCDRLTRADGRNVRPSRRSGIYSPAQGTLFQSKCIRDHPISSGLDGMTILAIVAYPHLSEGDRQGIASFRGTHLSSESPEMFRRGTTLGTDSASTARVKPGLDF